MDLMLHPAMILGFSVSSNSWLGPNRYGLFANRAGDTVNGGLPDVSVAWSAGMLVLGQTDSLTLTSSGSVVDSVSYDRFHGEHTMGLV